MAYQIMIGCTKTGSTYIGAKSVREAGCICTERVFGCQIRHRVVALLPDGDVSIMTPTNAKKFNATVIAKF